MLPQAAPLRLSKFSPALPKVFQLLPTVQFQSHSGLFSFGYDSTLPLVPNFVSPMVQPEKQATRTYIKGLDPTSMKAGSTVSVRLLFPWLLAEPEVHRVGGWEEQMGVSQEQNS